MAEVFAGVVCGFGLSLLYAPLMAITLLRLRADNAFVGRVLPPGVNAVALTVVLQGALLFFWTGLGIILGLALLALDGAPQALGSLNAPFTMIVFVIAFVLTAPAAVLIDSWRRPLLATGLTTLLIFGWLMPYLAQWSKFD